MKVCKMGLESIWIDRDAGSVRLCGATGYRLGNLTEHSIEELWHGEKAAQFRESMLDGSYCYCNRKNCPYLANHTIDSMMVEYAVPAYPKFCSLSYEGACNYVCRFCRTEKYIPKKDEKEKLEIIQKEVDKFIGQLDTLSSNGVGELFCSPTIMDTLSKIPNHQDLKIRLESNGSLFNEKNWSKISNLGEHHLSVAITVHSFHEDTYQFLSGTKLPVEHVIGNLRFISALREKGVINRFEIATVVCERNFREMPEYVKRCLDFNPDSIRIRFFQPYGSMNRSDEWFYDVRNPWHPYYEEFKKVMEDPVFKHPKVWKWQGETLSDQTEHPYLKEARNEAKKVKMLHELLLMEHMGEKFRAYLQKNQIHAFTLYGNGYVGQIVAHLLDGGGVEFGTIFDSYAVDGACLQGHRVLRPCKEEIKRQDMIIITSAAEKEIEKTLRELAYTGKVISLENLIRELNCCSEQ